MNTNKAAKIINKYNKDTVKFNIDEITRELIDTYKFNHMDISTTLCGFMMEERRVENHNFFNIRLYNVLEVEIIDLLPTLFIKHKHSFILNYPKFIYLYESLFKINNDNVREYIHSIFPYICRGNGILKVNNGFMVVATDYKNILDELAGNNYILMRDQSMFINSNKDGKQNFNTITKLAFYGLESRSIIYPTGVFFKDGFLLIKDNGDIKSEDIFGNGF